MLMKSFHNSRSWRDYRNILAEEFGIKLTQEPAESCRLVRGHKIRCDQWSPSGPANGTVMLVHGGGGNGRILAPLAEPIVDLGWRVIAPDLPGYGLIPTCVDHHP